MKRVYNRMIKKYDGSEVEFTFDDERPIQEQIDLEGWRRKKKHQFHVPKIEADVLEFNNWELNATYEELEKGGCIISLADSQMLEALRDITDHPYTYEKLEGIEYKIRYAEKVGKPTDELRKEMRELQYVPEYLVIHFSTIKQYESLDKYEVYGKKNAKKVVFNGRTYTRLSCSPSQARVQVVVYCVEEYVDPITERLIAGRDEESLMAPTKYNAYFGLYSSSAVKVTKPRMAIIGSHETKELVHSMYESKEEGAKFDVDSKLVEVKQFEDLNRFDGGGIIRPEMALQWAYDLGLDYVPANFCIRYTFTKGAVACFDFVKWCAEENDGNYIMKDIFGNEFDVRETDIVITKDMAKMIKQWPSVEEFIRCSEESDIDMRVVKYAPKEDAKCSTLNYQFLQSLDWGNGFPYNWEYLVKKYGYLEACKRANISSEKDIDLYSLANNTVNHYKDIINNHNSRVLFLTGGDVKNALKTGDDYLVKSLIVCPNLMNDTYILDKVNQNIRGGQNSASLGHGYEKGNFQCLIPDPYGFCEFMAGRNKVNGILSRREKGINCYSAFWNKEYTRNKNNKFSNKKVDHVSLARAPQTYKSEWVRCYLVDNELTNKWYKHIYSGFITPIFGDYTMKLAGSDFDYDTGFSTDDPIIWERIYDNKPVTSYDVPKPKPAPLTKMNLRDADRKSFGQKIGQITNLSTVLYCIQSRYTPNDSEYWLIESRLQQLCIAQSKQIDKTKIGEDVKEIPKSWREGVDDVTRNVLIPPGKNYKPYFMKYSKDYYYIGTAHKEWKTKYEELDWDKYYEDGNEYAEPFYSATKELEVYTDPCPMNRWAWYIEAGTTDNRLKDDSDFNYNYLKNKDLDFNSKLREKCHKLMGSKIRELKLNKAIATSVKDNNITRALFVEDIRDELSLLYGKVSLSVNDLLDFFYKSNKNEKRLMWEIIGKELYNNLKEIITKEGKITLVTKHEKGEIVYLYEEYTNVPTDI